MNIDQILAGALSLRDEAKKYTHQHVSVIPVGKNKIPLIPWKEFTERIASDSEIDAWFDKFPAAQIGIVTGKISKMTVVDVEVEGGEALWSKFPQDCPMSKTGGGGRHLFYFHEPGIKNAVRIMDNVDIRNDGGYIMAPPSSSDKGTYEWLRQVPMGKFPRHMFKIEQSFVPENHKQVDVKDLADIYLKAAVANFEGSATGGRNDLMTKFCGIVLGQVHPSKWDDDAWPAIKMANEKNDPPLPENELRTTYNSIKGAEIANNPLKWQGDPLVRPWELLENGEGDLVLMSEAAEKQKIDISAFHPMGIEIFDKEIMGGLHLADLVIVAGLPGEGKSSWAMNLTKNFIKSGEKVLFFSYEMLVPMVWMKFKLMGVDDSDQIYCPFTTVTGDIKWVEEKIKEAKEKLGVKIIVIDHFSFLTSDSSKTSKSAAENHSVMLTNIVRDLKEIAKKEKVIIIMPVHVRKQGQEFKKNVELDMNDIAHTAGVAQLADLVFIMQRERHKDKSAVDVYTGFTSITMVKNRWGHKNPKGYFEMIQEQFIHTNKYHGQEAKRTEEKVVAPFGIETNKTYDQLKDELFDKRSENYVK